MCENKKYEDILLELKLIAEENGYELTENAEKIAKFRARANIDLGKCVCDPKNPYRGCISNLCRKEIEEEKICHCRCFHKIDK